MLNTYITIGIIACNQLLKRKKTKYTHNSMLSILTLCISFTILPTCAEDDTERVTVFADRSIGDPGAYSIITTDSIDIISADHPAEIINQAPGVNIQMNSGQENLIALRSPVLTGGAGQGSFLLLENGVPIRATAFGNVNALFEMFHENADSIEVIRGPASAKYGSNAVHGLINVMHNIETESDQLKLSTSTLNRYRLDFELNSNENQKLALSVQDDHGWRDFTKVEQQKLFFAHKINIASWYGEGWFSASNLEQETADFIQGVDAYKSKALSKTNDDVNAGREAWSIRSAARLSTTLYDGEFTLTPYLISQEMSFTQHFLPNGGIEKNKHWSVGLLSNYVVKLSESSSISSGFDFAYADGNLIENQHEPFGFYPGDMRFPTGIHYDYDVETTNAAIWSELSWQPIEKLRLVTGLRGEVFNYRYHTNIPTGTFGRFLVTDDRGDNFSLLTPKLGFTWEPIDQNLTIFANVTRGARAPQASDLYKLQSQQQPSEAEVEYLDSFEIGLRSSSFNNRLNLEVAAYKMHKKNFFFRDANGLNVTNGKTKHVGIETNASLDLLPNTLTLSLQVTWSDQTYAFNHPVTSGSEAIIKGSKIDTAPEWITGSTLAWFPTKKIRLSLLVKHIGEYFTNPANTHKYEGHTIGHIDARYFLHQNTTLYLRIRNITDERYADRADFAFGNERYFPGEPLNMTLGVNFTF
ncbi:TonB-dependent receptor [Colwellia sp. E150_009]